MFSISNTAKLRDAHTGRIKITGETLMQDPHWKLITIKRLRKKIWSPEWPDPGICAPLTTPKLIYVSSSKNVHVPPDSYRCCREDIFKSRFRWRYPRECATFWKPSHNKFFLKIKGLETFPQTYMSSKHTRVPRSPKRAKNLNHEATLSIMAIVKGLCNAH